MKKVSIEKECGCFKKGGFKLPASSNASELYEQVNDMISMMNNTWCKKHKFSLEESKNELKIKVKLNECTQEI